MGRSAANEAALSGAKASAQNLRVRAAQVLLGCEDLNPSVEFFVEQLGFHVQAIFPADHPEVCILAGHGVCLRLERGDHLAPGSLRLECEMPAGTQSELMAPNGTRVLLVPPELGYALPDLDPSFVHTTLENSEWGAGRAGMRYRDLIPGRQGGRFIASHIQIQQAGPVPDYVHFHRVRFQMIYCVKGWVRLVYEDQGEPFVLRAGDCVLQPPEIRHRVLESSAGLEVVELGCPAEHATCGDARMQLPTPDVDPERDFSGQRFLRHVAESASWQDWRAYGYEARDIGMHAATGGLAGAHVVRPAGKSAPAHYAHGGEFLFVFLLNGKLVLERTGEQALALSAGDACVLPAGLMHRFVDASADCEFLEVCLPGELDD